jgi:hypothetical protein
MKCDARVVEVERRKKGSGEPYKAVKFVAIAGGIGSGVYNNLDTIESLTQKCDGHIRASVMARDEPDWGGTHARLEVTYECEKCKNTYFWTLPVTEDALSEVLQKYVDELPPPPPWKPPVPLTREILEERIRNYKEKK